MIHCDAVEHVLAWLLFGWQADEEDFEAIDSVQLLLDVNLIDSKNST